MKKILSKSLVTFGVLLLVIFSVTLSTNSCNKETFNKLDSLLSSEEVQSLASYLFNKEPLDSIPQDIDINDNTKGLPGTVDLTGKFPPIGNQGQYGTCVVWASGYNLKTALNGIEKGLTPSELALTSNQTSPKDLFLAIPGDNKNADCNGTYFEAALDKMIERGAASLTVVPYNGLGNCSASTSSDWDKDAANNKLENYRKIADEKDAASMTLDNFKAYLAEGRPIAFGAKLGDRFMQWNSDDVLSHDTYENPGMQHAYHALILAGYDNNRSAFRIINSWGTSWGDNGMIWVDYNFFLTSFCYAAFVAQNKSNTTITNHTIGAASILEGADLMAYNLEEEDDTTDNPLDRYILYDVYNSGTTTIAASQRWSILYLYYNAFNVNDYGIIIDDYYTDEFGPGDGPWDEGLGISASYWNNVDVPSGQSVAASMYNDTSVQFEFHYTMPNTLTGQYYLVLYADGLEAIKEVNEDNNFFFVSRSDGKPFKYENGILMNPESKRKSGTLNKTPLKNSAAQHQSLVKPGNLNTYSPLEIYKKLQIEKKSGRLQQKVKAFHQLKNAKKSIKKKVKS
jgi:C1A family cysteine protease